MTMTTTMAVETIATTTDDNGHPEREKEMQQKDYLMPSPPPTPSLHITRKYMQTDGGEAFNTYSSVHACVRVCAFVCASSTHICTDICTDLAMHYCMC